MKLPPQYHPRLVEMLSAFPGPGHFHRWLFRVALHMRHYHSEAWTFAFLRECAGDMDRCVPDVEIQQAISRAYAMEEGAFQQEASTDWLVASPKRITWAVENTVSLPFKDSGILAQDVLPLLFSSDDLVCTGASQYSASVDPLRAVLPHAHTLQFIVPSPMLGKYGTNQKGEVSPRCLNNTAKRRFLVVESDTVAKEKQVLVLSHLAKIAPLVLVVDSGGKSLHGWFFFDGTPEYYSRLFLQYACTLGADPHAWTRCQWVRMPGGSRYSGGAAIRQTVLYLDKEKLCQEP